MEILVSQTPAIKALRMRRSYEGEEILHYRYIGTHSLRVRCTHHLARHTVTSTMASQYPQYPHGHPTAYGPQRSSNGPYNGPPIVQVSYAPWGTSPQYRVDAHGRPVAQHAISSQSYPINRGQSNQYHGDTSIDSPLHTSPNMTRVNSSQSTGTSGSYPSPQSFTSEPKE
jgi:hypothetical protein